MYTGARCDLLIALHARRSATSIQRFHARQRQAPLLVTLTGTDLYRDIQTNALAQHSLELASRLIILQPLGIEELAPHLRGKVRVIHQSAAPELEPRRKSSRSFDVCVIGHLRQVKDPFRAAMAVRRLPPDSSLRVFHVGRALSQAMEQRATAEMRRNPRYTWLGEKSPTAARRLLARCHLLVLTSRMEGGANVISEALALDVPVLSSNIRGSIGILGPDYPGYFPVGDAAALAALLHRAETEPDFCRELQRCCAERRPLIDPARERQAWQHLLLELFPARGSETRRSETQGS